MPLVRLVIIYVVLSSMFYGLYMVFKSQGPWVGFVSLLVLIGINTLLSKKIIAKLRKRKLSSKKKGKLDEKMP